MVKTPTKIDLNHTDIPRLRKAWPWKSGSVDEVTVVNLVQMYTPDERIRFANELYRVMKPGARAQISAPHFASHRAYGDMAFQWPPVSEAWLHHLNAAWRTANAPWGVKYRCDFEITFGYSMHPAIIARNQDYQQHAMTFFKEACQDLVATLTKN